MARRKAPKRGRMCSDCGYLNGSDMPPPEVQRQIAIDILAGRKVPPPHLRAELEAWAKKVVSFDAALTMGLTRKDSCS